VYLKIVYTPGKFFQIKRAQKLVARIPTSQIDQETSDLADATSAHLTYTDTAGVKHNTVWYPTAKNLANIVKELNPNL
jgi:hypothetical protein